MTTVEYGGGPSLEAKQEFSRLQDGAHIPGYRGHCPQLKYRIGKTFGQETAELAQIRRCRRHQLEYPDEQSEATRKFHFTGKLPQSTGENKYTENMVPGYTGYIPRWPFKFGKPYKEECDICLEEFLMNQNQVYQIQEDIKAMSRSMPSLQPVSHNPEVRDKLNAFHERSCLSSASQPKRLPTEAPMPGYRGYIPRVHTTELGLGSRYHEMTKLGLDNFYTARFDREQRIGPLPDTYGAQRAEPQSIRRTFTSFPQCTTKKSNAQTTVNSARSIGPRIYAQDGMIPNYTGFVPQQRYAMGFTFGDETRSLEVCAHDKECYGDHVKHQKAELYAA